MYGVLVLLRRGCSCLLVRRSLFFLSFTRVLFVPIPPTNTTHNHNVCAVSRFYLFNMKFVRHSKNTYLNLSSSSEFLILFNHFALVVLYLCIIYFHLLSFYFQYFFSQINKKFQYLIALFLFVMNSNVSCVVFGFVGCVVLIIAMIQ